jgi:tetratricopeptide (TPR) repeat protein
MQNTVTPPDAEPTPEFNERCTAVMGRWQRGELPFQDALDQMTGFAREAAIANHPANQARIELLMGVMQGYRGNLDASVEHFQHARSFFERAGNRKRAIGCVLNLGECYRLKGSFPRARQFFRAAYEAAVPLDDVSTQAIALSNEGQMLLSMNRLGDAQQALEKALELGRRIEQGTDNANHLMCETHYALAIIYLRQNRPEDAWKQAEQGLRLAREIMQPLILGLANRAVGDVLTALGHLPEGTDATFSAEPDDYYRAAIDAFREMNAEGELARTVYQQALSLVKRGRQMTAARKLQQAMNMFTRLGMADDAAKAAQAQMDALASARSLS